MNCSSWADPTHSWALAAGSAFPASLSREPRKEGLRAWQQTRSTLAPPREDEPVNAVKPGFCLPVGSRNGVLEESGSAFLTAALLVWVEKHFWLGNVKQRTQRGGLFFLPPAKQLKSLISPLTAISQRIGNSREFSRILCYDCMSCVFLLWRRASDCLVESAACSLGAARRCQCLQCKNIYRSALLVGSFYFIEGD